jgi:mannose-1-phosphate guanylyltransferase
MSFIPVILCGGSGSRLYPLSRNTFPKQFVKINNKYSLLQNTILRFSQYKQIIMISNLSHKNILSSQIKELFESKLVDKEIKIIIYLEPVGKNTLPAISIVCNDLSYQNLLFIPCDHIYNTKSLLQAIEKGIISNNNIITFGVKPTYPETGFGYIESDINDNFVIKFIEKPNKEKAIELIGLSNIFWNSGIFLLKSTFFIDLVNKLQPQIINVINKLNNTITYDEEIKFVMIGNDYSCCKSISIDFGIMELLEPKQIYMIEYNDLWNDIGSFQSIYEISEKDSDGINLDSQTLNLNSSKCLVKSDRLVMLNNVSNLSIIDTQDIILISDTNKSQDVKKLYEMAIALNKKEISYTHFDYRPWGCYEVLAGGDTMGFKVKKIIVYPNKRLSLQSHNQRKEYWFCIEGMGQAQIDTNIIKLESITNSMVFIDVKQKHRLINNTSLNLVIIEIQLGCYLGEDDIVRYEDDYNRN